MVANSGSEERLSWLATHMGKGAEARSSLLAVTRDGEDHRTLEDILAPCDWDITWTDTCAGAMAAFHRTPARLLLCEAELPDGDWRRVWSALAGVRTPPLLIVAAKGRDDALWAEVLNVGGYDVLLKPFRLEEVVRTVHAASLAFDRISARLSLRAKT